jgi:hypothetical protein
MFYILPYFFILICFEKRLYWPTATSILKTRSYTYTVNHATRTFINDIKSDFLHRRRPRVCWPGSGILRLIFVYSKCFIKYQPLATLAMEIKICVRVLLEHTNARHGLRVRFIMSRNARAAAGTREDGTARRYWSDITLLRIGQFSDEIQNVDHCRGSRRACVHVFCACRGNLD